MVAELLKLGSFILELLRLCILLVLTLLVLGWAERLIYQLIFGQPVYNWSMGLGNLLLFLCCTGIIFSLKAGINQRKIKS